MAWFKGEFRPKQKHQMGLYISAARSWIFNHILQARIQQNNWYTRLAGDVLVLEDSHSWFVDDGSESLIQRLEQGDIHPSGALWGEGELPTQSLMRALELQQADGFPEFCAGLNKQRLKHDRRALRVMVKNLERCLIRSTNLAIKLHLTRWGLCYGLTRTIRAF